MKIRTIAKRIEELRNKWDTEIAKLEVEADCEIYIFPTMDIIKKNTKQYVIDRPKRRRI